MRHRRGNKKLGKPTDQRIALLRSLAISLVTHERIQTTDVRAKEASRFVQRIITLGKQNTLASRRTAMKLLPNKTCVNKVFNVIAAKYKERNGGYIRLIKTGFRKGDASPLTLMEFVD